MDSMTESLLDIFLFETAQNIERLEQIVLENEDSNEFSAEAINEIFRIMHTIKGSSAMMMFDNMSAVAHRAEDLFDFIRNHHGEDIDYSEAPDLVLGSLDFIRGELEKVKNGEDLDGDGTEIVTKISDYLARISGSPAAEKVPSAGEEKLSLTKQAVPQDNKTPVYTAHVFFEDGCQMESLRSFDILNKLGAFARVIGYTPDDITENDNSALIIREKGFEISFASDKDYQDINKFFSQILFLRQVKITGEETPENITEIKEDSRRENNSGEAEAVEDKNIKVEAKTPKNDKPKAAPSSATPQSEAHNAAATIINVNVAKVDKLMDLVGEMVISEAMVVENPDLKGMELPSFTKAARQLHKITTEMQDTVMSIRMLPLADVFQKMYRVVRDMSKKLDKNIKLEIIGEETEADKNIITHLSDPLMHLVRNAVDHGIESEEERIALGKPKAGTVTLEGRNVGNDVLVIVKDDGRGLCKEKILQKAKANKLLSKDESLMTDEEIYGLIFMPGFSTNEDITEYSGRGVGMDVVSSNVEAVGGSVSVDSTEGLGTTITIKIPLTLAIIDGMNIMVGDSCYTIPTTSIRESFRPKAKDFVTDPDGNEMIMVRGECFAIIRLHKIFNIETRITDFTEGIFIMVEQYGEMVCLFADELVGQQQVVVKNLPDYIKNTRKVHGLAGCTLLGNGDISLILDIGWFVGLKK